MIALTASALAGGYFYSDSGVVATGRGGAFIAGADTQFAQYYNPAGLIHIQEPTANFGFSSVQQHIQFTRLDADGNALPVVENQAPPFFVPQLGFTTPLIRDKLTMAVGMVSPFAPSSDYDPAGPQRYSIIDTSIYQFSVGPSFAWRPVKYFTVGLGLQAKVLILGQRLAVSASGQDDPGGDIVVDARVQDLFTPSFNVGLLIDPVEQLTIGLAVQPPTQFDAKGQATLDLSGSNLGAVTDRPVYQDGNCTLDATTSCAADDGIGLAIALPLVLRAGIAVRPIPNVEIEAAVVYQNWQTLDDIILSDVDPEIEITLTGENAELPPEFPIPAGLNSTISYRLGGEWRISEDVEVRAGGFYEGASIPKERMNVSLVDPAKVQIGAGGSIWPIEGRARFDLSIAGIFFPKTEIRDSEVEQIYVDVLNLGQTPQIVGNGDITASGWVFGFQGSWIFKGKDG